MRARNRGRAGDRDRRGWNGQHSSSCSYGLCTCFFAVTDCVAGDVRHVFVGEVVNDFPTAPLPHDKSRPPQDAEVLRDERLRHAERVDELMNARRRRLEPPDNAQTQGMGERSQQRGSTFRGSRGQTSLTHANISIHA